MARTHSSHQTRIDIVEHDVKGIKSTLNQVVDKLGTLTEAVLQMPKQSSVHERVKTISYTVGIYTTLIALLGYFVSAQLAPDRQTLARIERQTDDLAVFKYRIEQLEKGRHVATLAP
jgi:hypothetical protein